MSELMREYERSHFPPERRLDLQAETPGTARERALHWIQSRAHEEPGQELLLIVERGMRPGQRPSPVASAVSDLLRGLEGRLLDWWQPFAPGSIALRIADRPAMARAAPSTVPTSEDDGRLGSTAGTARPAPADDIPPELLEGATLAAELRLEREGLSPRILDVVLREVWIEAQAMAMEQRITFAEAIGLVTANERSSVVRE